MSHIFCSLKLAVPKTVGTKISKKSCDAGAVQRIMAKSRMLKQESRQIPPPVKEEICSDGSCLLSLLSRLC